MEQPRKPGPKRTKVATAFRYSPELLDRVRAMAADRHWTITTALELLLDDALTRAGYPAPNGSAER